MQDKNVLYYGDNLEVLRLHIKDESVDLIYLDPPFKSNQDYNVLFAERNGTRSTAQIKAFKDTWTWDMEAAEAYEEVVEGGGKVSEAMQGFRKLLGDSDMLAYLSMMAPRLIQLRRVLKPTGSIYLHCDPVASHYLKLLMDAVFGPHNFRNEVIWKRSHAHNSAKRYGPIHDVILFFAKSSECLWTDERRPYGEAYIKRFFKFDDKDGRGLYWTGDLTASGVRHGETGSKWRGFDPTEKGRHWMFKPAELDRLNKDNRIYWPKSKTAWPKLKRYLREAKGVPYQDIFDDIYGLSTMGGGKGERLGYPTQKPESLLDRIIRASSNEGDLVLDPFCGCGTTVAVAQRLNRRWVGIDITHLAVTLMKYRLENTFGEEIRSQYEVIGEPVSISGAMQLAKENPYQFQWWALGLLGARPVEEKKGADRGIDGRLYFHDEAKGGETKQIVFSVKSGHVTPYMMRDLRGVIEREGAEIGVLITMLDPTKDMRKEAAGAGFYESVTWQKRYPRIQILTIEDILRGKGVDCPPLRRTNVTFKKAPRAKKNDTNGTNDLFE